ncbi:MAG TPA: hypothetical protein VJJ21_01645 [Candidatus Nanoarchaeia archaeon]|nr:hypothetical protein [Candidatus Nanoarchaeia archaeon]
MLEILKKLESSKEFKSWKSDNPGYYLSSLFSTLDKEESLKWQFHYYSKEKDEIVTFNLSPEITIDPDSEVFKKKDSRIEPLEIQKVKLGVMQALRKIKNLKQYSHETFNQKIILLQQFENQPSWNISLITSTYQIINIKLSAISGKVLHESKESLLSFKTS